MAMAKRETPPHNSAGSVLRFWLVPVYYCDAQTSGVVQQPNTSLRTSMHTSMHALPAPRFTHLSTPSQISGVAQSSNTALAHSRVTRGLAMRIADSDDDDE